ncbi:MAG: M28 family peptidase [Verrucomicrobia bacterium]|nr:M28 family peptidase [Verrucomicrobiota bacterium]
MKLSGFKRRVMTPLLILAVAFFAVGVGGWWVLIRMPGKSYRGPLPAADRPITALRDELRRDVEQLADEIGERNVTRCHEKLAIAADFLEASFARAGYAVKRQGYEVSGKICHNLEVEIRGSKQADEIVVIGGHYDSVYGCPGANDNATGAAAVLALARAFAGKSIGRTLRFVEFVNEEPPQFQTPEMGSVVYAKRCRERKENIVAMLSLETMGYYSDEEGSQTYPPIFRSLYPSKGNFIAFVGNTGSKNLVAGVIASFRRHAQFPSEGIATWETLPGIGLSDHWSFWKQGYPALMVTDTAFFRYHDYHTPEDTPDKIDYERLARVVAGLEKTIEELANLDFKP